METILNSLTARLRPAQSYLLSMILMTPMLLVGCGSREVATAPPENNSAKVATNSNSNTAPTAKKQGLSNAQKVGITLAGAAALYYLYNQHKKAQAKSGADSQYYLSKNGRVYYRDAQHQVHWVNPPSQGVQVPVEEAQKYQQYQGYNNRSSGRDLSSLPEAQAMSN
jgi:hypothetical protein